MSLDRSRLVRMDTSRIISCRWFALVRAEVANELFAVGFRDLIEVHDGGAEDREVDGFHGFDTGSQDVADRAIQ